jgi:LemA protein
MTKPATITGGILVFFLIVGLWIMGNFNSLISSKNAVDKSWSKVETQYQRRLDLIDNLVSSTKGAQGQEREVFIKIAEARTRYNNASSSTDKAQAASQIETNVALLPRLQEAYPDLKSNQQVQSLMNQLTTTEDGILKARDGYNDTTTNYNIGIQRFPKNLFAGWFGFAKIALFKADSGANKAPQVKF